ncbi:outer membrane beta-barrel protein [Halorhodospira halophila]|uniref:outer membrane beta-barrel protein n=1 Tax=Halorhodospira halophila TaxID=1053 RepID=UPI0019125890|nr:outer membrane beta-barrel protein [Halorhodospira halophila]
MGLNKNLGTACLTAALLSAPLFAHAGPTSAGTWYTGLQGAWTEWDPDWGSDYEFLMATGRVGFFPTNQVAIETRLGIGLTDDDDGGNTDDFSVDHLLGVYGVGHLVTYQDRFSVYLIGGATSMTLEVDGDAGGGALAPAFGAGFDVYLHGNAALNVEYMRYQHDAEFGGGGLDADLSAINVGVSWML